jgi:hypothetical protein
MSSINLQTISAATISAAAIIASDYSSIHAHLARASSPREAGAAALHRSAGVSERIAI